jgi:aspartyl-tRNA(Asn)/glutamyl-tRNA(Gln) amidotransferase subunit C
MTDSIISDAEMEHLKELARLELSPEETASLKKDLNKILASFEQLRELDTEGVEALVRPVHSTNVFREDAGRPGLSQEEALKLAVEEEDGFFKVPRTVE